MNQLKNSHDLSLWITAFFAQRMGTCRPESTTPQSRHPIIVHLARPFAGRSLVSVKQRQFRREVTIARKRYTEGPALFRHLQDSIGYAMSAIAHFSAVYPNSYS
ncbi:hypothetical protein P0D72_06425 [Paraburkholderia sediminicola]|uniref:hypothetical protein n=1 Tax=Paraburkholderia sediminicola TaxID=458836 RepID=UPI0038B9176B